MVLADFRPEKVASKNRPLTSAFASEVLAFGSERGKSGSGRTSLDSAGLVHIGGYVGGVAAWLALAITFGWRRRPWVVALSLFQLWSRSS